MARWTDAMKLAEYEQFRSELEGQSGCYEIGYVRTGDFYACYVGKAQCLWNRVKSYNGEQCHNQHIVEKHVKAERKQLYFHFFKTKDYAGSESRLLSRWEIGQSGLYRFNQKPEHYALKKDYSRAMALTAPEVTSQCTDCRKACRRYGR